MKSASRSIATAVTAEPQTTGNTDAAATPTASVCSSSSAEGMSPSRKRSSIASSATTMPSTRLSCTSCSSAVELVGDLTLGVRAALVEEALVGEQVGDAAERGFFTDRQLERGDARAELGAQLLERALEAGALTIELVHEDHAGEAQLGGDLPDHLGLHLDAVDRAHDEDGEVGHAECRLHVADEVGVARGVDQVDLVALPLERGQREREAEAPLLLLGIEVGHTWCRLPPAPPG